MAEALSGGGCSAIEVPVIDPISAATGGVPMIGCTTAGEISTGAAGVGGVTVTVLEGGFSAATTCVENAGQDLFAAGHQAGSVTAGLPPQEHAVVMLLTDGLAGNQQEVVRGAYNRLGAAVPLVGGCAGDDAADNLRRLLAGGSRALAAAKP